MENWALIPKTIESLKDLSLELLDHQTAAVVMNAVERFERDQAIRAAAIVYKKKGYKGRGLRAAVLKDLRNREKFFSIPLSDHIIKHALKSINAD